MSDGVTVEFEVRDVRRAAWALGALALGWAVVQVANAAAREARRRRYLETSVDMMRDEIRCLADRVYEPPRRPATVAASCAESELAA